MTTLHDRLAVLKAAAFEDFENDTAYQRTRVDILELTSEAKGSLSPDEFAKFKTDDMSALYEICGTHLDLQVLERFCPSVLSQEDMEKIIQNSALARWM